MSGFVAAAYVVHGNGLFRCRDNVPAGGNDLLDWEPTAALRVGTELVQKLATPAPWCMSAVWFGATATAGVSPSSRFSRHTHGAHTKSKHTQMLIRRSRLVGGGGGGGGVSFILFTHPSENVWDLVLNTKISPVLVPP